MNLDLSKADVSQVGVSQALAEFTKRYITLWQEKYGHHPVSEELYGFPSPCIEQTVGEQVYWCSKPFVPEGATLESVERALEISLCPDIHHFYTTQFAGDMTAKLGEKALTLLQVWSEDDFVRLQENLIGHLVTQKRLKLPPTLFLATTDDEMAMYSLCNRTGEIVLEQFGSTNREIIAESLVHFLTKLEPVLL